MELLTALVITIAVNAAFLVFFVALCLLEGRDSSAGNRKGERGEGRRAA